MRAGSAGGTKRGREGEPIPRRCRAEFMFSSPSCPTAAVTCGTAMTAYELSKLLSRPLGKETLVVLALTTFFVYSVRWTDSDGQSHTGPAAALAERMGRGVGRGAAAAGHPRKLGGEPFRRHRPGPGDPPLRCHRETLPPLFCGAPGGMGGISGRCQGILSAFCPAQSTTFRTKHRRGRWCFSAGVGGEVRTPCAAPGTRRWSGPGCARPPPRPGRPFCTERPRSPARPPPRGWARRWR